MVNVDPPINELSLHEKREAGARLRSGKAAGIRAELLKAGNEAMIRGLNSVLTVVRHSGTISSD